ncbi:DNA-binding protein [Aeromonas caviae]|uniref:DNA-binding protein n=1 Tax=Aeromonas caviae TaxID=648 RepID=UPI0029D735C5|nr:DNA-binding protein [Aeromonas caviae]MDX7717361.1 DNA-binding protein [Aeromonas caviae]
MSTWFTAQGLAGLIGIPAYPDGVRKKAEREEWQSRKREKGKGVEYHISSLPAETRRYLAEQAVAQQGQAVTDHAAGGKAMAKLLAREVPVKPDAGRKLLTLGAAARKKVDVRLLILQAADIFLTPYQACQQGEVGRRAFIEAYRTRSLSLPASVYEQQKPFSLITLRRWQGTLADAGPAALAGNYQRERPSSVEQSPDLARFLTALITAKPHLANKWGALHELATQYSEMNQLGWQIPSQSSLRRWLVKWLAENKVAFTYATNPDAYNNKYRTAIEEMYPWMGQPNDVWEFDSTPVDAMLVEGRHSIIAVIDVFTRRVRLPSTCWAMASARMPSALPNAPMPRRWPAFAAKCGASPRPSASTSCIRMWCVTSLTRPVMWPSSSAAISGSITRHWPHSPALPLPANRHNSAPPNWLR